MSNRTEPILSVIHFHIQYQTKVDCTIFEQERIVMNEEKGIAYCGLACCLCSENEECVGWRNDGCKDKDWCKNYKCCKKKGIQGCWECKDFPCSDSMLDKMRIRAFTKFISQYGEEELLKCLERNKKAGTVYHYEGQLVGDYVYHNQKVKLYI